MRGKRNDQGRTGYRHRITPAYAGKKFAYQKNTQSCQDHPRLCGEKSISIQCDQVPQGSPPPMRGKSMRIQILSFGTRITPAYAGKNFFWRCGRYSGQDHPRLCGEKKKRLSSGTLYRRITPAYAGKNFPSSNLVHIDRDHPRLCGEKLSPAVCTCFFQGSPPPMRGKS